MYGSTVEYQSYMGKIRKYGHVSMVLPLNGDAHGEVYGPYPADVGHPVDEWPQPGEDLGRPPGPQRRQREDGRAHQQVQRVEQGQHHLKREWFETDH